MGFIAWIIMGLVVGVIAKFLMPGKDPGGIFITIILGIAGAFVGGMLAGKIIRNMDQRTQAEQQQVEQEPPQQQAEQAKTQAVEGKTAAAAASATAVASFCEAISAWRSASAALRDD